MGQHGVVSILSAVFTGLSSVAVRRRLAGADPTSRPGMSFNATKASPVLAQQFARLWTTSIPADMLPACLRGLRCELGTTWLDERVPGRAGAVLSLGPGVPGGTLGWSSCRTLSRQPGCTVPVASVSARAGEADLHFSADFPAVLRVMAVVLMIIAVVGLRWLVNPARAGRRPLRAVSR